VGGALIAITDRVSRSIRIQPALIADCRFAGSRQFDPAPGAPKTTAHPKLFQVGDLSAYAPESTPFLGGPGEASHDDVRIQADKRLGRRDLAAHRGSFGRLDACGLVFRSFQNSTDWLRKNAFAGKRQWGA